MPPHPGLPIFKDMAPRVTAVLLLTLLLAACAAPQPSLYAPKASRDGYAEEVLGKGLYRISFQGNRVTSKERVQEYCLFRAAELTLELGAEKFAVHDKQTERYTKVTRESYAGWGDPHYYRYGYYRPYPPPSYDRERTTYQAWITIEPFTGAAPGGFQVYDARATVQQFAPRIERPKEQPES
ncbi:MAG: hypothetical protein Tsb0032_42990 [Kiloniellaceae bacterium]